MWSDQQLYVAEKLREFKAQCEHPRLGEALERWASPPAGRCDGELG